MINHARNLLVNVSPGRFGVPGEELIPPTFVPKVLDGTALSVRRVLFGHNPDLIMLNVRTRQLLTLLHSCQLRQYVYDLDSRITYDVDRSDLLVGQFGMSVQSANSLQLWLVGELPEPDINGICEHVWRVSVNSELEAEIRRTSKPLASTTTVIELTDGVSQLLTLPGTDVKCRFEPAVDASWHIRGVAAPSNNFARILTNLERLGDPVLAPLFGVTDGRTKTEPYATLYTIWTTHPEYVYKLGALLLAYIYYVESLPTE